MTSIVRKRISSICAGVAILLLLGFIVFLWLHFANGAFRDTTSTSSMAASRSSSTSGGNVTIDGEDAAAAARTKANKDEPIARLEAQEIDDRQGNNVTDDSVEDRSRFGAILRETNNDSNGIALVRPIKISPVPLHVHDIIYEQLYNNGSKNGVDEPYNKHHSGHFRQQTAEIWDPHPEYKIATFNRTFQLKLMHNEKFLSPDLYISHVWHNFTQRVRNDPKTSACFYTGTVKGDDRSHVAVSLCNGMTGYIRTGNEDYYIRPIEQFRNNTIESIMHEIVRVHNEPDVDGSAPSRFDVCETEDKRHDDDDDPIAIDDVVEPEDVLPMTASDNKIERKRRRRKRDAAIFDYIDTDANESTIAKITTEEPPPKRFTDGDDDDDESVTNMTDNGHRTTRDIGGATYHRYADHHGDDRLDNEHEYFIEVMVVADKQMADYHKDRLQFYVMTLMSQAALLFKDATIGNPITLSVVHIVILPEHIDFGGRNSEEMLRVFCEWQTTISVNHDVALLLTRQQICKKNEEQCSTLGVAEVGSMCTDSSSCAIVRDKGLSTSYTIAHEIGHVLNMPHDDDLKCQKFNSTKNIMSKMLYNDTQPWLWSYCSKHYLTEFLDSSKSKCLLKPAEKDYIDKFMEKKFPGEEFVANQQCEMEFKNGSVLCEYMPPCRFLWCTNNESGCSTQRTPWAEGTKCGQNKWCHKGVCEERKFHPPTDGGWGEYKSWSSCSRTCGGGIMMAKRECDSPAPSHGGAYCKGRSVKYASCNVEACGKGEVDFRYQQCAAFNNNPRRIQGLSRNVKWVPKYGTANFDESCKLYCRVKSSSAYYLLRDKVVDGTKCGLNSFNICVNGQCRPGGCDNALYSNTTLDECGVCGGDNSQCEEVNGAYNLTPTKSGYHRVFVFPKGSSRIIISQRGYLNRTHDDNYLALVDSRTGEYILNGKHVVSQYPKDIVNAGTTISYSGSERVVETITTPKHSKLTQDLILEVLSAGQLPPPDITYRYIVERSNSPKYSWLVYNTWSECNSVCNGTQQLRPICVDLSTNGRVADEFCASLDINGMIQTRGCNTHCYLAWKPFAKSRCSTNCGEGYRSIMYKCAKYDIKVLTAVSYDSYYYSENVSDSYCAHIPQPGDKEKCQGVACEYKMKYGKWSECSKSCGAGTQTRTQHCVDKNDQRVEGERCGGKESNTLQRLCNEHACPTWASEDWTPCSVTCGTGYRMKPYYCQLDGTRYPREACDQNDLPPIREECAMRSCPPPARTTTWVTGAWSGTCSKPCGGTRSRTVACRSTGDGGDAIDVDDVYCADKLKPNATQPCDNLTGCHNNEDNSILPRDVQYQWITSEWSMCSKSCDNGTMSRAVVCRDRYGVQDERACELKSKPVNRIECNVQPCPNWNHGDWGECDTQCNKRRQVICETRDGKSLKDAECDASSMPPRLARCKPRECKVKYKWIRGEWGGCSRNCGTGKQTRQVRCKNVVEDAYVVDTLCTRKPRTKRKCTINNCDYTWVEGPWSECSTRCGEGTKTRNVSCHKVSQGYPDASRQIHDGYCDYYDKPSQIKKCYVRNCNQQFKWKKGEWSACSRPCGKRGHQKRDVYCTNARGTREKSNRCPAQLKPAATQKCNREKCYHTCKDVKYGKRTSEDRDYFIIVRKRPAMIYCHAMNTDEPKEYISLHGQAENYAEFYDRRLTDELANTCPYNGQRRDDCQCSHYRSSSGLTHFYKVRLNVTNMQIIANDYRFSRTTGTQPIAYGTAGDCYSNAYRCTQGRFRIDLRQTSFRVSGRVKWKHYGTRASSRVSNPHNGQYVEGTCGGNCGRCEPEHGLAVEVAENARVPHY